MTRTSESPVSRERNALALAALFCEFTVNRVLFQLSLLLQQCGFKVLTQDSAIIKLTFQ